MESRLELHHQKPKWMKNLEVTSCVVIIIILIIIIVGWYVSLRGINYLLFLYNISVIDLEMLIVFTAFKNNNESTVVPSAERITHMLVNQNIANR